MPREISTSRIILDALDSITGLLKNLKINYALMGGLALAVWGRERATKDIDIVIGIKEDNLENLIELLKRHPFSIRSSLKRLGDSLLIFASCEDKETGFAIDIDLFIAQTQFQDEALKRSLEIEVLDKKLKVVTVEDLILYKLLANRPIDYIDAHALLEENIAIVDKNHLRGWAKRLGIRKKIEELLKYNA